MNAAFSILGKGNGEWIQKTQMFWKTREEHILTYQGWIYIFNKIFMRSREQEDVQMETRISFVWKKLLHHFA